jgi:hypothetical protein
VSKVKFLKLDLSRAILAKEAAERFIQQEERLDILSTVFQFETAGYIN